MFSPGQDVMVIFDGDECRGEVIDEGGGWVLARIMVDPCTDYGAVTPRLDPRSLVMVRDRDVSAV